MAEALAVDVRRVRLWIKSGELPAVDVGPRTRNRRWRIAQADLEAFLTPPIGVPAGPSDQAAPACRPPIIEFF